MNFFFVSKSSKVSLPHVFLPLLSQVWARGREEQMSGWEGEGYPSTKKKVIEQKYLGNTVWGHLLDNDWDLFWTSL